LLAAPDRRETQGQCDHAVLLFLYNTGARASEAAHVKVADLDHYCPVDCERTISKHLM
jgi:integrase/recombinase XerD